MLRNVLDMIFDWWSNGVYLFIVWPHAHPDTQAWEEGASRSGVSELGPDAKWEAGVALLAAWGDREAAERYR